MSASQTHTFWDSLQTAWRSWGFLWPTADVEADISTFAEPAVQWRKVQATIQLIDVPEAPTDQTPPDHTPPGVAMPVPRYTPVLAPPAMRHWASQLAITASQHVPHGRKAQRAPKKPAYGPPKQGSAQHGSVQPRKATAKKSKPVAATSASKRSAKRRHVWLSTQARAITPISANVVPFSASQRMPRQALHASLAKTVARSVGVAA